ncbi:MAG TPA: hypothetical protein ACFCUY_08495 [Xenococcaceae cyanobacterium]
MLPASWQRDRSLVSGWDFAGHWVRFTINLDYGIPLIDVDNDGDSLQENGLYFSLSFQPF